MKKIFPDDKYQMDLLADYLANTEWFSKTTANRLARRLVDDGWDLKSFTRADKTYGEVVGCGKGVRKFAPLDKEGIQEIFYPLPLTFEMAADRRVLLCQIAASYQI